MGTKAETHNTHTMIPTERHIITAMQQDAHSGFRLLMQRYAEPVYWHLRRMVCTHDDAEDAAQETFLRVYRAFATRRADASLTAWIYSIATREALRLIEQRQRLRTDDITLSEATTLAADEYVDYSDLEAVRLQRAVHSLPTVQQLAFNLRYYDELSYEEIAVIAGSTPQSVKVSYAVARRKITEYMQQHD